MKRKILMGSILMISIILIFVVVMLMGQSQRKDETKKSQEVQEQENIKEKETDKEEQKDDKILEKESKELLHTLLEETNYNEINIEDEKLNNKYNALKSPLIYHYNVYTIKNGYNSLISAAVFYNIKDEDIEVEKTEDKYTYGYINKEKINSTIRELFGTNEIQFSKNSGWNYLQEGYLHNTTKAKYYHADFIEDKNDKYYFKFFGLTGDGNWSIPQANPDPIKMMNAREYKDYILVTSKAVYTKPNNMEETTTNRKMNVCADTSCNKIIGEITVNNEQYFTLNIDNYIENAGTIYTIFKKNNDDYYYYKNIIDNV